MLKVMISEYEIFLLHTYVMYLTYLLTRWRCHRVAERLAIPSCHRKNLQNDNISHLFFN